MRHHLRQIALITILLCLGLISVQAKAQTVGQNIQIGDFVYRVTSNIYPNFEVAFLGYYWNAKAGGTNSITVPSTITYNGDEYKVTSLVACNLTSNQDARISYTIPNTIKRIEMNAVNGVREIILEDGNTNYILENHLLMNTSKDTVFACEVGQTTDAEYSLNIPSTIKVIATSAFRLCNKLTSITLPSSLEYISDYAFYNCGELETCTTQEGLTYIGDNAFNSCTKLKEITIPKSVTFIGDNIFNGCDSLKTMHYNAKNAGTKPNITYNTWTRFEAGNLDKVIIGSEVQTLPYRLFDGCSKITEVNFPASLRSIGGYAFRGCNRITSLVFPDSLQTIDNGAFEGVVSVSEITIPTGLTYMGNNAFGNTTSLKTVHWNAKHCNSLGEGYNHFVNWTNVETATIGNDVEVIPWYLFANCKKLKTFTLPEGIDSIGMAPLYGCDSLEHVYYNAKNAVYTGNYQNGIAQNGKIQNFVIGSNVETIPDYLLSNEKGITSLSFPSTVKKIGDYAFNNCGNLSSAPLPDNIVSIGNYAFSSTAISKVTIPTDVTYIGLSAFAYCTNLSKVIYKPIRADYPIEWLEKPGMFYSDTSLAEVIIDDNVEYIPNFFLKDNKKVEITLPNNLKKIGFYAFAGTNIKELTITDKIDTIGQNAFENCDSLTIINYNAPSLVNEMIPSQADGIFKNCKNIQKLTIDENITSLPQYLFYNCNIDTIYAYPLTAPLVSYNRFYRGSTNWVWVPCGSYDSYYNTWKPFTEVLHRLGDTEYTALEQTICEGEEFEFNGQKLTQSGEYVANLLNKYECDSIVTLNLTVNPVYDTLIESIIQSGDTYTLNGFTQQSEGNYIQNLQTVDGCDSIIRLSLTTLKSDTVTLYDTVTLFDTITNEITLYDTVTLTDTITVMEYLHDTIMNTVYDTTILTQLDTVILHDTITNEITLYDTVTLYDTTILIQYDTVTLFDTITNEITLYDTITVTNTITDTVYITEQLTDTIFVYDTVTTCSTVRTYIYATINEGSVYEDYGFNISEAGTHILNLQTEDGCDSIVTLYISFNSGIDDVTETKVISVYPNPAKDKVTIKADGDMTIFNTKGQMVKVIKGIKGSKDINVSDLESGVYYVKTGDVTKKLIVK